MVKAQSSGLQKSLKAVKVKQEQEELKESQEAKPSQQWEENGLKESQACEHKKKKNKSGRSGWAKWNAQRKLHALEVEKAKDEGKKSSGRVIQTGVKRAEWPTFRSMEVQTDDSDTEWVYIDQRASGGLEESLLGNCVLDSCGLEESPKQEDHDVLSGLQQGQ